MKSLFSFALVVFLSSCGGGTENSVNNDNKSNSNISIAWTKPNSNEGFLVEASQFKSLSDLNSFIPYSDNLYAHFNPQSGALNPGIKFMMFGTPNSLCPSSTQGDLLSFSDNFLSEFNLNPLLVKNELRFEPKPMNSCSSGSESLHGPNVTFLDGNRIWMKTQSTTNSSALLKTFNDSGQDGSGVNANIIGNFTAFRFKFPNANHNEFIKPFAKNNTARISLSGSIQSLDSGNVSGTVQPKQQIMATFINPDCYDKKLSICQVNLLINMAIARNGVSDWNSQSWAKKSNVWLDSAQGNLPIWEAFLPDNGNSLNFNDTNTTALTSRGEATQHNSFENKIFNAEIPFDSFKTTLRLASAKILNKQISTDSDCIDCVTVFGTSWNDVNKWVLLDTAVGQEVYDSTHNNGKIIGNFDWIFVGSKPD